MQGNLFWYIFFARVTPFFFGNNCVLGFRSSLISFHLGPTSPHTPTTLPDIYIQDYSQDWTQECEKGLLDRDFVDTLREGLEPIDDQLMAELTRTTGTFVDPAVEEQFKMNY